MIKIAVCDDEKYEREKLCDMIRQHGREYSKEYELQLFESGEQFLESGYYPHILFLDIIMSETDGIQTGAQLKKRHWETIIIYITNLSEKMTVALNQIHSFGYLIKPVEKEQFDQMMFDALKKMQENIHVDTVTFLSENNTIIQLPVTDIYYFEYFERKIKIVAKDQTYVCIKEKISAIAEKMEKYGFEMSHQSFVVNLYYVDKISYQTLLMRNGDEVFLAQKRTASLKKKLMQIAKETTGYGGSINA